MRQKDMNHWSTNLEVLIRDHKGDQTVELIEQFKKDHPEYWMTDVDKLGDTILTFAIYTCSAKKVKAILKRWGRRLVNIYGGSTPPYCGDHE